MTAPSRDEAVQLSLDPVLDDEPMPFELGHQNGEVDVIIGEHVELEFFRLPTETALSIGDDPEPLEPQADRELCFLLQSKQSRVSEKIRFNAANPCRHFSPVIDLEEGERGVACVR
jgi:hypothetical protein